MNSVPWVGGLAGLQYPSGDNSKVPECLPWAAILRIRVSICKMGRESEP